MTADNNAIKDYQRRVAALRQKQFSDIQNIRARILRGETTGNDIFDIVISDDSLLHPLEMRLEWYESVWRKLYTMQGHIVLCHSRFTVLGVPGYPRETILAYRMTDPTVVRFDNKPTLMIGGDRAIQMVSTTAWSTQEFPQPQWLTGSDCPHISFRDEFAQQLAGDAMVLYSESKKSPAFATSCLCLDVENELLRWLDTCSADSKMRVAVDAALDELPPPIA
ncbi:MAG: hypothetical protein NT003_00115 [Candidatus Magasanikbacteria bacterium]|nr:hypothetical protein [Candidatus Magasanikbacteria bacterium]